MCYTPDSLSQYLIKGLHDTYYLPNFITPEEEEYLTRKIHESPQPQWKRLANRRQVVFHVEVDRLLTAHADPRRPWCSQFNRLQIWGGDITAKGTLLAQSLPSFVERYPDIIGRIKSTGIFDKSVHKEPNHIIMNEYLPGQGIMPHEDGPRYHPVVATLSLGSHTVFHYYQYQPEENDDGAASRGGGKSINTTPVSSLLLEPRSLVISSGPMYTAHLHGIEEVDEDFISPDSKSPGTVISNLDQLQDSKIKSLIQHQTPLKRGVRYSLTCRDVERVSTINTLTRR